MARMVRKQVYIGAEHEQQLNRRARELGLTESELIRRGIERIAHGPLPRDQQALRDFLAFVRGRAERLRPSRIVAPVSGTGRGWTREELYDRRPPHAPR